MGSTRLTDLLRTSLPRGQVRGTADQYLSLHDEARGGTAAARRAHYRRMVGHYYDLVTDFYEFGWGQSFHFAPRHRGESLEASIARHELFLALRLGLRPGMTVLDVGCGVGGPMRTLARFSGATIVGINNHAYQVARGIEQTRLAGLSRLCSFLQADFMDMPADDDTYDAVYAIEATCHAPDKAKLFSNLHRVMKAGAVVAGYEWCLTPRYDAGRPAHREIKRAIEEGDAIPELATFEGVLGALRSAGLEVVESRDVATESDPETPWYLPLSGAVSLSGFKHTTVGRVLTHAAVRILESLRIAPAGSTAVSTLLNATARALVRGGRSGIFTPMFYFLARKPSALSTVTAPR